MAQLIQVKRSTTTAAPGSLANGEFAITSNGDVLFIGSNGAVLAVGGRRTPGTLTANQALVANSTSYLDVLKTANLYINATTVNAINATANTTVLGAAGNNELTTTWAIKTYVDNQVAGGGKSGGNGLSQNTSHIFVLANSGLLANSTGVFVIANSGLVSNSTGVHVIGNTGVTVNSTGVFIGQNVATTANVTFNDLTVSGNLVINGTLVTIDANNLAVEDSLISLARLNNATDTLDIGFFGLYDTSGSQDRYAGLFRDASDGKFRLFANTTEAPLTTVNTSATGYAQAILVTALESSSATITGGSITGITDLATADGGTGLSSFTANGIFYASNTTAIAFASGADGKVLTSVSGVPTFTDLDGGTF